MKIILALGNPGRIYKKTRHNVGFTVLDAYAKTKSTKWKTSEKFNAEIAEINDRGKKTLLIKPSSYYNESGQVVRRLVDFYKINTQTDLLVIHDDLSLPLATIRVRKKGSDAGNNGIKSINSHIGEGYARIRIGAWNELRDKVDDAKFVLNRFARSEQKFLEKSVIPNVSSLIDDFVNGSLEASSTNLNK